MISAKEWQQVLEDFKWRCAYCQMPAIYLPRGLEKEHILPRSKKGSDTAPNICPACSNCNGHKADKIFSVDPHSGKKTALFHPRKQNWNEHFTWDQTGVKVLGLSPTGRATISALKMNLPEILAWRAIIVRLGGYPPDLKME